MKKIDFKKKLKRLIAGGLMVCLMMPSFAGATWADVETYDYTGITKECLIDMDLEALQEKIEYAISYDMRFNSSSMKFDSEDEELVKQYEKLFSDKRGGEPLYYVDYEFEDGVLPTGARVSVFVRKQRLDAADAEGTQTAPVATPTQADIVKTQETHQTAETNPVVDNLDESSQNGGLETSEQQPGITGASEEAIDSTPGSEPGVSMAGTSESGTSEPGTSETETSKLETIVSDTLVTEISGIETSAVETSAVETSSAETSLAETSVTEASFTETSLENTSSVNVSPTETSGPADATETNLKKPDATETAAVAKENVYDTATGSNADKDKVEDYKITGNEEIILFFQNKSIDDYIFQIRIGNRQTGKIYVPSASVLLEEAELEKKGKQPLETLNSSQGAGGDADGGAGGGAGGSGTGDAAGGNNGISDGSGGSTSNEASESFDDPLTDVTKDTTESYQSSPQNSQETGDTFQSTDNNSLESGDVQDPEADAPAADNNTHAPEADAPAADNNTHAPEADAPAADSNTHAPEADVPSAGNNTHAPEADAPAAVNNNHAADDDRQEPEEVLEVSISSHQAPRLTAPIAGEVNDEDFENRPDAGVDEEVSYSDDYKETTDPNEELGAVLEALIYKEKGRIMLYSLSSGRKTSGASVSFLMKEVGLKTAAKAGGTLTIKKEMAADNETIPEGTEYTYDVKITNISPLANVTLEEQIINVSSGTIETSISVGVGQSISIAGLTTGSKYTITPTGVSDEAYTTSDEITIQGGEGFIDVTTGTVTGVIQNSGAMGEGEIIWDMDDGNWYDEAGNLIDVETALGADFEWYYDWYGIGHGTEKITTSHMLNTLVPGLVQNFNDKTLKVALNLNEGGIDIFYGKVTTPKSNGRWYSVRRVSHGRTVGVEQKDCYSIEEIESYMGKYLINWEADPQTGEMTTLTSFENCWEARPVHPFGDMDLLGAPLVTVTYLGTTAPAATSLILKKQLVTSPDISSPMPDDENQTFLYRIENMDTASPRAGEIFYATLTVEKGQTEASKTLTNIPASTQYRITELENLRYLPIGGESQTVNTKELDADITFTGYKAYTGYFSDTNVIVNRIILNDAGTYQLTTDYPDGQPLNVNVKLTPPPALLPDRDKSGLTEDGDAEYPAA